jgi:hypothetical protein
VTARVTRPAAPITCPAGPVPAQPSGLTTRCPSKSGIGPGVKAMASQSAAQERTTPPTAQRQRGPGTSPSGNQSRASRKLVGTAVHSQLETQAPATVSGP